MKPLFKFYLQVNTGKEEAISVAEETVHYLLGAGAEVTVCRPIRKLSSVRSGILSLRAISSMRKSLQRKRTLRRTGVR